MFIKFDGIMNARDLGGLRTAQGTAVKSGLLLRTARLHEASDCDISQIAAMGVRTIFDFRDPSETERTPDRTVPGAEEVKLPVLPEMPDMTTDAVRYTPEGRLALFREMYITMAESDISAAAYGKFFETLLQKPGAPVLWHCTQGKDRTGIASLLLLTALGVPEEDIRRDYMLSNDYMQGEYEAVAASGIGQEDLELLKIVFFVREENLNAYIAALTERYGGVMGYLLDKIGLSVCDISQMRKTYTE